MPTTPTYPGVYIQELPSSSHTISPAPTSIAAFVGYTHPLKTPQSSATPTPPAPAIQVFSFADYQNHFGGFFNSPWTTDYMGPAIYQFFLNGGATAYVVGLTDPDYTAATVTIGTSPPGANDITLTAREPVGTAMGSPPAFKGISMQLAISNLQKTTADNDTADIVITYGSHVETYRKVVIGDMAARLGTVAKPVSALVTVDTPFNPPSAYPLSGSPPAAPAPFEFSYATAIDPKYSSDAIVKVFTDNFPLDKVPIFNLLVVPGVTDAAVLAEGVAYSERKRAFYIMDSPANWEVDIPSTGNPPAALASDTTPNNPVDGLSNQNVPTSTNAAIYYPWLQTSDPITNAKIASPPSGFVAGVYAAEDSARGVWKSPAGLETTLNGTLGVVETGVMTDNQQGNLNDNAINCLRVFPPLTPVVYGARTLAHNNVSQRDQWGYIAVRRMALFLEQSLYNNLTWAVFEPNDTPLWHALTQTVSAFMLSLFRQGAFAGTKPSEAFLVVCDSTTTTQTDINNGVVNVLVGFAPLKPAEFVIVQIAQLAGQGSS
ncbi:phage tail sheath subtilisin-like domain-containing protein [Mycolicibacterium sp. lyk4-40-TYG-92]|jgi:phage tail sheath protein FI|uniref:phage tail sheath family protein n=1 Tax=Mycolicibacterium sp. lyk4-40-TYG-92 TaxID=3040295 RepID=UPI00254D5641|nr:phage tail sheath subtilisin-like domain-containing protein [Mycolicibacterium sp. lyk4-40-TYG-92]